MIGLRLSHSLLIGRNEMVARRGSIRNSEEFRDDA